MPSIMTRCLRMASSGAVLSASTKSFSALTLVGVQIDGCVPMVQNSTTRLARPDKAACAGASKSRNGASAVPAARVLSQLRREKVRMGGGSSGIGDTPRKTARFDDGFHDRLQGEAVELGLLAHGVVRALVFGPAGRAEREVRPIAHDASVDGVAGLLAQEVAQALHAVEIDVLAGRAGEHGAGAVDRLALVLLATATEGVVVLEAEADRIHLGVTARAHRVGGVRGVVLARGGVGGRRLERGVEALRR